MKTEDYLKLPYSRVFIPEEEDGYSCYVLEFRGCFSMGDTVEEAMTNINDAMECWIEASLELGRKIPEPYVFEDGIHVTVEIPRSVYFQLIRLTEGTDLEVRDIIKHIVVSSQIISY